MPRRLVQLFAGLVLYGVSSSMLLLAGLGVDPWDVLHQGLARRTGIPVGTGAVIDLVLAVVSPPRSLPVQVALMVSGVVLNGVATGLYIGAGLGPGPRDGLMTGFAARGHSLRLVRTCIEITVLAAGWLLGGTVGVGTVVYAVCIGPLAHVFVPLFSRPKPDQAHPDRDDVKVSRLLPGHLHIVPILSVSRVTAGIGDSFPGVLRSPEPPARWADQPMPATERGRLSRVVIARAGFLGFHAGRERSRLSVGG